MGQKLKRVFGVVGNLLLSILKHSVGRCFFLGAVALIVLLLFLLIYRPTHRFSMILEAGSDLPDPVTLTDQISAIYLNPEAYNPSIPGDYRLMIGTEKGKYYLKIRIEDTIAPIGTVQPLNWGLGTVMPEAKAFFSDITDATAVTASYLNSNAYGAMGTYPIEILLCDVAGNETRYSTTLTLLKDTTPPTVTIQELSGCIGYGVAYSNGVIVSDDCCGELKIEWDASAVDTSTPGKYPVYYTVTDASGNATRVENTIYIYEEEITPEMLYVRVDRIIDEIITANMNSAERVRAVYSYVYKNISYAGTSDKSDWMREAYQVLSSGSGDCFSYFALAKAFFERLGIENMDIQRTTGLTPDRHYWNYVNIGTSDAPAWYYFDATHLNSSDTGVSFNGALLTEQQIMAYNKVRAHFYTFDHTGYPAASTEIITDTPALEPYY